MTSVVNIQEASNKNTLVSSKNGCLHWNYLEHHKSLVIRLYHNRA